MTGEFPAGSNIVHHTGIEPFYMGISADTTDTLVTRSFGETIGYSNASWDTVYEVRPGDTVDIGHPDHPYYKNYTAHSFQDLVTRYNDYNPSSLRGFFDRGPEHRPQYIDIYQRSWTWPYHPVDKIMIVSLDVVYQKKTMRQVWHGLRFGAFIGPRSGTIRPPGADDYMTYHPNHKMVIAHDAGGSADIDGGHHSALGVKIIPPNEKPDMPTNWTIQFGGEFTPRDTDKYRFYSSGRIESDQIARRPGDATAYMAFGSYEKLDPGDTLSWRFALIFGEKAEHILQRSQTLEELAPDYEVPIPPPPPELRAERESRKITLKWGRESEDYTDPNRESFKDKPFEGYRIYKSTKSAEGPWTLLAEYDIMGNSFGLNTGLRHTFVDSGLMDNVTLPLCNHGLFKAGHGPEFRISVDQTPR